MAQQIKLLVRLNEDTKTCRNSKTWDNNNRNFSQMSKVAELYRVATLKTHKKIHRSIPNNKRSWATKCSMAKLI